MNHFSYRPARPADIESLVHFNQQLARETEGRELNQQILQAGVRAVFEDPSLGFYLVAAADDAVIGGLLITKEWSDWRNGMFWWIQSVYVESPFRRQGVFRGLYRAVRSLAVQQNVCGFRLYVEKDNEIAQHTYAQLGMHETFYKMFEQPSLPDSE